MKSFVIPCIAAMALAMTARTQDAEPAFAYAPVTLRVAGSSIVDTRGEMAGYLEAVVLDRTGSQIQFALVSTGYPSNRFAVTPVPWNILQHRYDARAGGGVPGTFQQFVVPVDRAVLAEAPTIHSGSRARTNDLTWMTATLEFFGRGSAGTPGSAAAAQTGGNRSAGPTPAQTDEVIVDEEVTVESGVSPFYGGGVAGGGLASAEEYLRLGTLLFGPGFLTNAPSVGLTNGNGLLAGGITNAALTNVFLLTNVFGTNFHFANTNVPPFFNTKELAVLTNVFGTNLAMFQTNFLALFTNRFGFQGTNIAASPSPSPTPSPGGQPATQPPNGANEAVGAPPPNFGSQEGAGTVVPGTGGMPIKPGVPPGSQQPFPPNRQQPIGPGSEQPVQPPSGPGQPLPPRPPAQPLGPGQ